MPNNTETYWDADGTSLHTFAKSIETLSGMALPQFRGEDIIIPSTPGQTWVPKVPDSRVLPLAMWIRGLAEHASNIDGPTTKAQLQSNYHDLIRLLWTPGRQVALTKRFYDGGVLRTATALAEYNGGMEPTMRGQRAARCVVNMKLADPYFYETAYQSINLVAGNNNITVLGNAPTNRILVNLVGPRVNPKLINSTLGVEFTYPRSLLTTETATITVQTYEASELSGGAPSAFDTSSYIIHAGSPQWLVLRPGANVINLSSSSGSGTVQLQYKAAWV